MKDPKLTLAFDSPLKAMIWGKIVSLIDTELGNCLAQSQLINLVRPSEEAQEQLAAVEAICREIKEQINGFDLRSTRSSPLDVLSRLDVLRNLLTEDSKTL